MANHGIIFDKHFKRNDC